MARAEDRRTEVLPLHAPLLAGECPLAQGTVKSQPAFRIQNELMIGELVSGEGSREETAEMCYREDRC